VPVKGLLEPVEVYELTGVTTFRRCFQVSAARGLTQFVGRQSELDTLRQALTRAGTGHGQVVALIGEAGIGKSRLVYECVHSHHTQGWRVLEAASVSYGKATPYFPVLDLLRRYAQVDDHDDPRTVRAKITGYVLTLDATLQETLPALLSLLEALPEDSLFLHLDPPQRRQRTLAALQRLLLRDSQVQPLLLVFEDLHWIDSETQALLDGLVERLPTAQLLLLVNYPAGVPARLGQQDVLHATAPGSAAPGKCGRHPAGAAGGRCQPGTTQAASDRAYRGQSLLSGGKRTHAGRDRRAGWGAGCLCPGKTPRQLAGTGDDPGRPGGAHRSPAA
jgi:AAA ATPase domain